MWESCASYVCWTCRMAAACVTVVCSTSSIRCAITCRSDFKSAIAAVTVFFISEATFSKSSRLGVCEFPFVSPCWELGEAGDWACTAWSGCFWVRNSSGMFLLSWVPGSMVVRVTEELRVDLFMMALKCRQSIRLDSIPGSQELTSYAAISVSGQATPPAFCFFRSYFSPNSQIKDAINEMRLNVFIRCYRHFQMPLYTRPEHIFVFFVKFFFLAEYSHKSQS